MNRYICIHGHFYQPPRENPWLEEIEQQDSAHPYHDWNERITAECYAPNAASRILGPHKKIFNIVNNYAYISFNFGPTLLSWMQRHAPEDYQNILQADEESRKRFSGHGSALAQVYNHMIMPLAATRDARTQVWWGIKDFEHRFRRRPEGMWLAETAVNTKTLEILAAYGIQFTILAPHQAQSVRKIGEEKWQSVQGGKIDPQRVYLCRLPSGRTINLFFYDGPVSNELAFQDLLRDGENFARRLTGVFPKEEDHPRLMHAATDGETYGHHHRFGDMALAYCLHHIQSKNLARVTVYAEYLEKFPATYEVQIAENTSWSCAHGIERWRGDCGCRIGTQPGWHQKWRRPLRVSLDWLRDAAAAVYERHMGEFTGDPWRVRDQYIEVILDRSPQNIERFLKQHVKKELNGAQKVKALKLLEMQRHAMLMYTSCGWFFDDIAGIEAAQILLYAARVIQLAREISGEDFYLPFKTMLEKAPGNSADYPTGAAVYEKIIKPQIVDFLGVGAHYAIASLFDGDIRQKTVYCYTVQSEAYDRKDAGRQKFVAGRAYIRCEVTWEENIVSFAVIHLGGHILNCGVKSLMEENDFHRMQQEIKKAFFQDDASEMARLLEAYFGPHNYSLKHLFKDEQKRIFGEIISSTLGEVEEYFRQIYDHYYPLMQAKEDLKISLPSALTTPIEFVLAKELLELLGKDPIDIGALEGIVKNIRRWSLNPDQREVALTAGRAVNALIQRLRQDPYNLPLMQSAVSLLRGIEPLHLNLDLWRAQNNYFFMSRKVVNKTGHLQELEQADPQWIELFKHLGDLLGVHSG